MQPTKPMFTDTECKQIDDLLKQMNEESEHLTAIKDGTDTEAIRAGKKKLKDTTVQLNNLLNKKAS